MIEPVNHKLVIRPFDIKKTDERYASAQAAGIVILDDSQRQREQQAVDRGTVVSLGPTVFKDFGADCTLKPGDEIVYAKYAGKEVTDIYTKEQFVIINDEDVVAIFRKEAVDG